MQGFFMLLSIAFAASLQASAIEILNQNQLNKYQISIACDNEFSLYIDERFVGQGNNFNNTYLFELPTSDTNLIAILAKKYESSGAFIGDFGNLITKPEDWKCEDYTKTPIPNNWFNYDFDDSKWNFAKSYGKNTDNNTWQINEEPRQYISYDAQWLWTNNPNDNVIICRHHVIPYTTTTFDTTINNTLEITAQWGSNNVTNNIYSDLFILNKIY